MLAISVLIVNYNGEGYLEAALDSLRMQTFRNFEVIVVDNASTDGSADDLRADGLPAFRLLAQDTNLGFAAGSNVGVKAAAAPWVAMLNPDAEAKPDWLEQVLDGIRRHSGAHMFTLPLMTRLFWTGRATIITVSAFHGAVGSAARRASCRKRANVFRLVVRRPCSSATPISPMAALMSASFAIARMSTLATACGWRARHASSCPAP